MEPRAKVVPGPGKHSIYTHFPKHRNCDICFRTKITRASCRRRTGTVVPKAENFSDVITADHKVFSEGCESRHNHRYAVVVQDLATQETQKSLQKSLSRQGNQKSFTLTTLEKFATPVKNHPEIIVRQHHTDQNRMGLLREQCVELRKGQLRYCCNLPWMKKVGLTPWNVSVDLLSDGRTPYERRFGVPLKARLYRLEQWSNVTLSLRRTYRDYLNSVLKSCQDIPWICVARGVWKGDVLVADIEELEKMDASEIHATKPKAKEVLTPMNGDNLKFPIADGTVKVSGGDLHLGTSTLIRDRPERGWRFYLPSSRGIESQTAHAERRIISDSTEIYRRYQKYLFITECDVGEKY